MFTDFPRWAAGACGGMMGLRKLEVTPLNRRQFAVCAATGLLVAPAARAEEPPTSWDGLIRVPSKKLKFVYLAPATDFRPYSKVMIDPTEVAVDQKWVRQYNESVGPEAQISAYDIRTSVAEGVKRASDEFDKAFAEGGFQVVSAPGPDVLRVRTAILNIQVAAPDVMTTGGRTFSSSRAAGAATFVVEVRDSQSNALLGRAVDVRLAGDNGILNRNSVTNWSDFRELIKVWAKISVAGLHELQTLAATPSVAAAG